MNCDIEKIEAVLKNGMKSEAVERDVILKIENLSIFYGEKLAVDQINLEILKNQVTAIIGPLLKGECEAAQVCRELFCVVGVGVAPLARAVRPFQQEVRRIRGGEHVHAQTA